MRTILVIATALAIAARAAIAAQGVPATGREAYRRALDLEARGNGAAALTLLWQAAGLSPADPEIQNHLGEALERMGALDAAVDAYRRALAAQPGAGTTANNLILALVRTGRGPEAVALARSLSDESPDDADRLFTLGLAQSEQNLAAAMETFRRVLTLAPRHVLARYNLALALTRADRSAEAVTEIDRLLAIDQRPEAFYLAGVIHTRRGETDAAITALRAAVEARPGYREAEEALGAAHLQRRDYAAAIQALRRAVAIEPAAPSAQVLLARALRLDGQSAEAARVLATADALRRRESSERESVMLTSAGIAAASTGDLGRGIALFTRAVSITETYAPAYYQLGLALRQLGREHDARASFERAHALNPAFIIPTPERN